jgi:carbon monoxide dehydrogenase subunit G
MGSIRREAIVGAPAEQVWERLRDVGNVADLFPGVLTNSRPDGDGRVVTFATGMVLRERIIDVDDHGRRVAYAAVDGPFAHHNASMQILPATGTTSRFIWISDFLPDELRTDIEPLIDFGTVAFVRRWER